MDILVLNIFPILSKWIRNFGFYQKIPRGVLIYGRYFTHKHAHIPTRTYTDGWLFGFYDKSTFMGYLMPNSFSYKKTVLFQTILFSMCTEFVKNIFSSYSVQSNSYNANNLV